MILKDWLIDYGTQGLEKNVNIVTLEVANNKITSLKGKRFYFFYINIK